MYSMPSGPARQHGRRVRSRLSRGFLGASLQLRSIGAYRVGHSSYSRESQQSRATNSQRPIGSMALTLRRRSAYPKTRIVLAVRAELTQIDEL